MGMDGSRVWECFLNGELGAIRDYCETDVLNTYLIYLRFEQMRGRFTAQEYTRECDLVRRTLEQDGRAHLREFLERWHGASVPE